MHGAQGVRRLWGPADARVEPRRAARGAATASSWRCPPDRVASRPTSVARRRARAPSPCARALAAAPEATRRGRPRRRAAARDARLVQRCIDAPRGRLDGAIAAAPVTDTVKEADGRPRGRAPWTATALGGPDAAGVPGGGTAASAGRRRRPRSGDRRRRCWSRQPAAACRVVEAPRENLKVTDAATCGSRAAAEPSLAVLTDYHVHLRPDEDRAPAGASSSPRQRRALSRGRRRARHRGAGRGRARAPLQQALDVWQHPFWKESARRRPRRVRRVRARARPTCKLGIEADFVPGREDRMAALLDEHEWDYVVGSVHFLRDEARRHARRLGRLADLGDPDKVWARYFETLGEAARTGMFDILAHPDLVKVWGTGRRRTATCAGSTSSRWRASRSRTWRSRCPPRGCASRSARSTRRGLPRDVPGRRQAGRALLRRPHARAPRLRVRRGRRVPRAAGRRPRSPSSSAPRAASDGAARMSAPHGHRVRLPPPRGGAAADPRRRGRSRLRPRPRRPLRRRRAHPRDHRRAAGRRRPRRHRPALPRHRRGAGRTPTSIELLAEVCTFLEDHGWTVRHVDCTVICEAPKLGPHRDDDPRARWPRCIGVKADRRQRQVHDQRGDGLRRPRRGHRSDGGRDASSERTDARRSASTTR